MKNEDESVPVITEKSEDEKVIEIAEDWRTIELPPSPKYKPGSP